MEASFFVDRWPSVRRIGGFDVIADIGRSGIADLYLALAPEKDGRRSRVVIKHLPDTEEDEDERTMFLDEARLARNLRHPNLIQTIDVGKDGRSYYIVAECLDGQLLSRIRKRSANRTAVPLLVELRIASEALAGLHYLHELKDDENNPLDVVHRDVTPHRVFVTYTGEVKIADFAIAKASVRQTETQVGVVKGDLLYFAPEVLRRQPIDRRADIFAMGMMLWEAAAGRRFWAGFNTTEIHQRLLSGELPRETAPPNVPVDVLDIIHQAMEPDPDRRFATAHAMRQAIDELLGDRLEGSMAAVSTYVQRTFIEERRRFYQSARAAEDRLGQGRKPIVERAPAPLQAIDSETLVRVVRPAAAVVAPPIAPAPADAPPSTLPAAELASFPLVEEPVETTDVPTSTVSTTFAQPTWRPPTDPPRPPRRVPVLMLCFGAAAMLAAGWALAQVRSHAHGAVVAAPSAPSTASAPAVEAPSPARDTPPAAASTPSPSASAPPAPRPAATKPPSPRVPGGTGAPRRTVPPKDPPATPSDSFGI
jgi:serine/threonine-protein kinase